MATKTQNQTCTYKGKTYLLLWTGDTKYGRRAKLGFMDGSKEFWVDASAIGRVTTNSKSTTKRRTGTTCPCCGKNRTLQYDMEDGMMKCYDCCDIPE